MAAQTLEAKDVKPGQDTVIRTTLLDLIWEVNELTEDDGQTLAVVTHLVNSGQVELTGNFKGKRLLVA